MSDNSAAVSFLQEQTVSNLRRAGTMLGRMVVTEDGIGILIETKISCNGLYIEDAKIECCVWYGTSNPSASFVWRHYHVREVTLLEGQE